MNNQSKIEYALNELIKGNPFADIGDIFSKSYLAHTGEKQYKRQAYIIYKRNPRFRENNSMG